MRISFIILVALVLIAAPVAAAGTNPGWQLHWYPYAYGNMTGSVGFWTNDTFQKMWSQEKPSLYHHSLKDIAKIVTTDYAQDLLTQQLIDGIQKRTKNPDDQARIAISLVKNLPATGSKPDMYSVMYPYEVLAASDSGVCVDHGLCLAYVLSRLGYDTCIFYIMAPDMSWTHVSAGVKSPQDYQGTGYAVLEISEAGAIPGSPGPHDQGIIYVYKIGTGTRSMNLSREVSDGKRLQYLQANFHYLNQSQYREYSQLIKFYGV